MPSFIPNLIRWRNEMVVILAIGTTIATEVILVIGPLEVDSVSKILAALPVVLSLAQRMFAYGEETYQAAHSAN